ncbi:MAG TPA: diphthine--ammonia ligase [Bacteroidia bacterium]|nr:diphthine--ammonia ligase [Bacteroidia bacterium]
MSSKTKALISWSGGKDSTFALHKILKENKYQPEFLFVTINKNQQRVSMHGVRKELITRQGLSIGIHTRKLYLPENVSMEMYNKMMEAEMKLMKQRGVDRVIFGDIFLEDLKKYREEQLQKIDLKAEFPLWGKDTKELYKEFVEAGYKVKIVSVNLKRLSKDFLGKDLSLELLNEFPEEVDVCGENGEYHTFVYDGEIFNYPIEFEVGEVVEKSYQHNGEEYPYAFLDLKLK